MNRPGYKNTPVKQAWMARFSEYLAELDPNRVGSIDWDTAHHFFFSGLGPLEAATRYADIHRRPQ